MGMGGGKKDIIEIKTGEGRRKADAFISVLRAVDRENLNFSELRVTLDIWCSGLTDAWGNNVAATLKGFLDRVEDEGMDTKNLSKAWRYFERALVASVPEILRREDLDVARGFEKRWSEYIEEASIERTTSRTKGVTDAGGVQVP